MDIEAVKPPWETIQFLQSPYLQDISGILYDLSWNEIPHEELNKTKKRIEPLEANHSWENLKKKTNPYELVYTQDSNTETAPSISILKPLSRSYFKMIEMLDILQFFDRLPKGTQRLRSAHVAEGPGGFIEAFLDRASARRIHVVKSSAMTLKPTNNHIPGWRRTYSFLQKHPEVKIHYGSDNTGDLYKIENQKSFIQFSDKVLLFTGDGGFDFSVDYEHQEKSVFPLLVASALIGIQVLQVDGVFVLKLFDLFSESTQLLIRTITVCFKEWTLYKPATSRPCNSERYLVCRGFRRIVGPSLKVLETMQAKWIEEKQFPRAPFFSFFTEDEKKFLESHIHTFDKTQNAVLEETIELSEKNPNEFSWKSHISYAYKWCSYFHIPTIALTHSNPLRA